MMLKGGLSDGAHGKLVGVLHKYIATLMHYYGKIINWTAKFNIIHQLATDQLVAHWRSADKWLNKNLNFQLYTELVQLTRPWIGKDALQKPAISQKKGQK